VSLFPSPAAAAAAPPPPPPFPNLKLGIDELAIDLGRIPLATELAIDFGLALAGVAADAVVDFDWRGWC
jgi:hypothetical protein